MLVSIITVVYNGQDYIERAVKSVLSQDYPNIEYIVVDGNSSDSTMNIVNSYKGNISQIISEKDKGIYDAMNKGIKAANGDIVGFLNADDCFQNSNSITAIMSSFTPDLDAVYGDLIYVDSNERIKRIWKSKDFIGGLFSKSWTPAHPTFYCRRGFYIKYGLYKIDYKIAADVELMFRFLEIYKIKTKYLNQVLVRMQEGGVSNAGLKSTIIITQELRRAFAENGRRLNVFKYLFYKLTKVTQWLHFRKKSYSIHST